MTAKQHPLANITELSAVAALGQDRFHDFILFIVLKILQHYPPEATYKIVKLQHFLFAKNLLSGKHLVMNVAYGKVKHIFDITLQYV